MLVRLSWLPPVNAKHVCVSFEPIDGNDNVVGFSRPLLIRASGDDAPLTVTGRLGCRVRREYGTKKLTFFSWLHSRRNGI